MADLISKFATVAAALSADPREAVQIARRAGFSGVLFDAVTASLDLTVLSHTGHREFRRMLSHGGVELVGFRADCGPKGLGSHNEVDRIIHQLDSAMDSAARLGAPLLCVDVGSLPGPTSAPNSAPTITPELAGAIIVPSPTSAAAPSPVEWTAADRALAKAVDSSLAELCARADRYNVVLALRSDLASLASLAETIDRVRCPWIGMDLDTVALLRDRWNIDQAFSALGPLIGHVRARDAILGADGRTQPTPIGKGSVEWNQVLANCDQSGFKGWITIDPIALTDRYTGAQQGLSALRAIARR